MATVTEVPEDQAAQPVRRGREVLAWLAGFAGLVVVVGALAGAFWWLVVDLPAYVVNENFTATTTERGLTQVFGSDAWFSGIALVVGAGLGIVAWRWFGQLGWVVSVIASLGSVIAGLVCWWTGTTLGPGSFDTRLAAAQPGDVVPVELSLHAPVALLIWVFAAVTPILLRVSLGPDPEETSPRRAQVRAPEPGADPESGEVVGHDIAPLAAEEERPGRTFLGVRLPRARR